MDAGRREGVDLTGRRAGAAGATVIGLEDAGPSAAAVGAGGRRSGVGLTGDICDDRGSCLDGRRLWRVDSPSGRRWREAGGCIGREGCDRGRV